MNQELARDIVARQVLAAAWDNFVDEHWDIPDFYLPESSWQAVLEEPFITYPYKKELNEALEFLGGVL